MNQLRQLFIVLITLSYLLSTKFVFSNGINPPRPQDSIVIEANCTEISSEKIRKFYRVHIDGAAFPETLNIKVDNFSEHIPVTRINRITFSSNKIDSSGYSSAKLLRQDEDNEQSVSIQVRSKTENITLNGFNSTGEKISVEISKCRVIDFSVLIKDDYEPRRSSTRD